MTGSVWLSSQQNGIAAIVLALVLERDFPGTVGIVAPAVLVITVVHASVNAVVDRYAGLEDAAPPANNPCGRRLAERKRAGAPPRRTEREQPEASPRPSAAAAAQAP